MRGTVSALVELYCDLFWLASLWLEGRELLGETAGAGERGAVKYACARSWDEESVSESVLQEHITGTISHDAGT